MNMAARMAITIEDLVEEIVGEINPKMMIPRHYLI